MAYENNNELFPEDTLAQHPDIDGYSVSGEIRSLSTSKLCSGQPYQRPVKESAVNKLIREWDDRLLEPIAVSFRDGRFHVIDGQHRIVALKKMNGGKDVVVACRIYTGLTHKQEAELCFKLDKAKKRLTLAQSTNALMESNANPRINEIRGLVEKTALHGHWGETPARNMKLSPPAPCSVPTTFWAVPLFPGCWSFSTGRGKAIPVL